MKHEVIERTSRQLFQRVALRPRRRATARPQSSTLPHSRAVTRFAETCAAIGGTTMLHDLMPDVVTISFGARTDRICKRLRSRGWSFVGTGEWQGERVLGVSFAGDRRATKTADDLVAALIAVVGELEIAETRVW
jgi:hypothetical protein